jgi:2-methylcitrate dehydratase PrpD
MTIVTSHPIYDFIEKMDFEKLPPEVIAQAKICLVDLLATLAAGTQTALTPIMTAMCNQQFSAGSGAPSSLALSSDTSLSPAGAALLDGMVIDSMDAHDGHSLTKGHVGCAVIAAINSFISSSEQHVSGQQLLCYLIAGYEIGTRSGIVLHETCSDYHSSGAWNAITCAALGGHFLDLDTQQFEHALGIAEYHGPRSQLMRDVDHPTMVKDGSGWGAMAGVSAAYMAKLGFTGAPAISVFENDVAQHWQDLGSKWHILDQYLKPYPVCRWAHPAIDAALHLMREHNIQPSEIRQVQVHTFHQATRLSQMLPETTDQAQYGIIFPIAVALAHGGVAVQHILEPALKDPETLSMFKCISIIEDDQYSELFPAQRLCTVNIKTNKKSYQSAVFSPRGEGDNPLSEVQRLEKYQALTFPVWGENEAMQVFKKVDQLDKPGSCGRDLLNSIPRLKL